MEYELIRSYDLESLSNPTTGWKALVDKEGEPAAKQVDLSKLSEAEDEGGVMSYFKKIGSWDMRTNPLKTITLSDPDSIIGIRPGWIVGDDGKRYLFHGVYDPRFYQQKHNCGRGNIGIEAGALTLNTSSANVGSALGSGITPIIKGRVAANGSRLDSQLYSAYADGLDYTIERSGNTTTVRLTQNVGIGTENAIAIINMVESGDIQLENYYMIYNGFVVDAVNTNTAFDFIVLYVPNGIPSGNSYGSHTHSLPDHAHNVPSLTGNGVFTTGPNGMGIMVYAELSADKTTLLLTHNYYGDDIHVDTAFGIPASRSASEIMSNFDSTVTNRGYIEIIRKFDV